MQVDLKIVTIDQPGVAELVQAEMDRDGVGVPIPTHVCIDPENNVYGAFSVYCLPFAMGWVSKRANGFKSRWMIQQMECVLKEMSRQEGFSNYIILLERSSPLYNMFSRMGYVAAQTGFNLLVKE